MERDREREEKKTPREEEEEEEKGSGTAVHNLLKYQGPDWPALGTVGSCVWGLC